MNPAPPVINARISCSFLSRPIPLKTPQQHESAAVAAKRPALQTPIGRRAAVHLQQPPFVDPNVASADTLPPNRNAVDASSCWAPRPADTLTPTFSEILK